MLKKDLYFPFSIFYFLFLEDFYLPSAFIAIVESFFLKEVFEKFQFKVAMCLQSSRINELIQSFIVDIRKI